MLTRLKVSGFKNLMDVDVRFGPFTCIAGGNGTGKSNLFDAIRFLGALAELPLMTAALAVRGDSDQSIDARGLFTQIGKVLMHEMSFEAEMILPATGRDELGREVLPTATLLRYTLHLGLRTTQSLLPGKTLPFEIVKEELLALSSDEAKDALLFPHAAAWRESAVYKMSPRATSDLGRLQNGVFISTTVSEKERLITLHMEHPIGDQAPSVAATTLPRTVLSAADAALNPTAYLAQAEFKSWQLLQLEPAALRMPDAFAAPIHIGSDGAHLAATLYHSAHDQEGASPPASAPPDPSRTYARVANRLAELIGDVQSVDIDEDESRQILTLYVRDHYGATHTARSLSDGTLRFLALAILELDSQPGIFCIEEPENGIHPDRIPALLELLSDIAMSVTIPIAGDNPLRQVIISTHSPAIVSFVPDDCLLLAQLSEGMRAKKRFNKVTFRWLADTWRVKANANKHAVIARGAILPYLNPVVLAEGSVTNDQSPHPRRVIERPDIQEIISPIATSQENA